MKGCEINMSYVEKMNVIDFIIETLKEHEKALDEIVFKLNCLLNSEIGDDWEKLRERINSKDWR